MAAASDAIHLSGGDLVRKFNDGDDGSLPTGRIKADRMLASDWKDAARKTQRNQREFMEHVGPAARRTEVVVRDAPVFLTTDDSEGGCGYFVDGNDVKHKLGKAVFGYDEKVTRDTMKGFYMGVVSNGKIHQCVPVGKEGEKPEDLDERRARAWKYLARVAQLEQLKEAAKSDAPMSVEQSAEMIKTVDALQSDSKVQEFLYDKTLPKTESIKGITKKLQKLAQKFPRLMPSLAEREKAQAFATKMFDCAQQTKKEGCAEGQCGWLGYTDPLTGEKAGVCFPGAEKKDGGYESGTDGVDAIMGSDPSSYKTVGDLLTAKRLTAPEREMLEFWKKENKAARAVKDEDEMRVWRRVRSAVGSPSGASRLGLTLGGGEVPSVFSTAGSDTASEWSAGGLNVF